MINKSLLVITLLALGNSAHANLQEKLAAKCDKINIAKQDVRAGKAFVVDKCAKCKSCRSCSNCNFV